MGRLTLASVVTLCASLAGGASGAVEFAPVVTLSLTPGSGVRGFTLFDRDADGDLDLAIARSIAPHVLLFDNAGGVFVEFQALTMSPAPRDIIACSFFNTGIDLAVAQPSAVAFLTPDVFGNYAIAGTTPVPSGPRGMSAGDVDSDGDLDLALASEFASSATLLRLIVPGVFASQTVGVGPSPRTTAMGDFDLDGSPDLAVTAFGSRTVHVFELTIDSIVRNTTIVVHPTLGPTGIVGTQLDGEARSDFATIMSGGGVSTVASLVRTPEGWQPTTTFPSGGLGAAGIASGDLDGDGIAELVVSNSLSQSIAVFPGVAWGGFGSPTIIPLPGGPANVSIADLDGDGDRDLVVLSLASSQVHVLRNTYVTPTPPVQVAQHSWINSDGTMAKRFSDYGEVIVDLNTFGVDLESDADGIVWLNASIDGLWALRDVPFLDVEPGRSPGDPRSAAFQVALPRLPGVSMGSAFVAVGLTPEPTGLPPLGEQTFVAVTEHTFHPGAGLQSAIDAPLPFVVAPAAETLVPTIPGAPTWESVRVPGVGGVDEDWDHCTPAAVARLLAWLNARYCLEFPPDCDEPKEIYDKLRDATHMETTATGFTRWWGRDAGSDDLDPMDPVWGKFYAGLKKFLEEKGILGTKVQIEMEFFKKQSGADAINPCDLFDALAAGKAVIANLGYWSDDVSTNNATDRASGHSISVVGAVKCGERVTIYYRDDSNGVDGQADGATDRGVKSTTFEAGGATGWKLLGERWEGFVAVCPTRDAQVASMLKAMEGNVTPAMDKASGIVVLGGTFADYIRKLLLKAARDIDDSSRQLLDAIAALDPACPAALAHAQRIREKSLNLSLLMEFFVERATAVELQEIQTLVAAIQSQLLDLVSELVACDGPPCLADIDDDGVADGADLAVLLGSWGDCDDCPADLNNDGVVDGADLALFLGGWGACPE